MSDQLPDAKRGVVPPLLPLLELPPQPAKTVIANTRGAAMSVRKVSPQCAVFNGAQEAKTFGIGKAVKWSDVDWPHGTLHVERGIVRQQVGDVKSAYSRKQMSVDPELLEVIKRWKQTTQFGQDTDWVFASPVQLGTLPWSYPWVWRVFQAAASDAGVGKLATHTMRHSYRAWLDAVGTSVAVQQKLMRHADIRTTMNIYGDVVTDEMSRANTKVVGLAPNGR